MTIINWENKSISLVSNESQIMLDNSNSKDYMFQGNIVIVLVIVLYNLNVEVIDLT